MEAEKFFVDIDNWMSKEYIQPRLLAIPCYMLCFLFGVFVDMQDRWGKFILFLALAERGKGNALFVFSLAKRWVKNKMCIFLCGGLSHLFFWSLRKNVKPQCNKWTSQRSNIKLQRKNIIPHRKNIKSQRNNWTPHRANITPQRKKIKLHRWNVTLHRKNIKTSRSNIIFGSWIQYSKRLYILVK